MTYTVNEKIGMSMKILGMTQKKLGSLANIPAWRVSDIVGSRARVTANELYRIAEVFGVPLDCFIKSSPLFDRLFDYYNYSVWKK